MIDSLTVADNLGLGESYAWRLWLSEIGARCATRKILDSYGIDIDASAAVASLRVAERTMVAIARALHHGPSSKGVLVLDEPTAAFTAADKDVLFGLNRAVRDRGCTVVYVTRRPQEVFDLADRVTILREGRRVATRSVAALDYDCLIELILRSPLGTVYPDHDQAVGTGALEVENPGGGRLQDLSLSLRAGEIVGIVGLTGSGAEEVPHLLFGRRSRERGVVRIDGRKVHLWSPAAAIKHGIAFVPGERERLGSMSEWSVRENLTLPRIKSSGPLRWLSKRLEIRDTAPYIAAFDVRPATTEPGTG